jgi:D-alanine-D-alanine ligase
MATKKLRVGLLYGGKSGEHEVSLLSAASILKAIDRTRFDVILIGINKQGGWLTGSAAELLLGQPTPASLPLDAASATGVAPCVETAVSPEVAILDSQRLDVVFPVLHGTFGEDGTIQGLFDLVGIPYVGSGVLGSAAGMDKDAMKALFRAAKLPLVKHVTLLRSEWKASPRKHTARIEAALSYPIFVKPANLGSSVGISKVHDRKELAPAMELAARYDRKIVLEQGVGGKRNKARELEVAVLGNESPVASVVGEIIPGKEFYDYEDKYLSTGSVPIIPAKLTKAETKQIQAMAVAAFRACDLSGLSRVDFLMEPSARRRIYLNEVNTMPGFTSISMYPKLWQASGIGYTELITKLIELALERHADRAQTTFEREE